VSELAVRRPPSSINRSTLSSVAEIEVGSEAANCECGLDQYEVRRWQRPVRSIAYQMTAGLRFITPHSVYRELPGVNLQAGRSAFIEDWMTCYRCSG
jgi:hypothetical protein